MIKSNFELENDLLNKGYQLVIGIDEVGRGPLAGPVVAAAVVPRNLQFSIYNFQIDSNDPLRQSFSEASQISNDKNFVKNLDLVRDSKTLSEKQREKLFNFIHENFFVGIGMCDHETIDRINILEASFLAMKSALSSLKPKIKMQNEKCIILVDGNKQIPNLSMEQKAIINGDKIVKSISAASIIAKVTRDRMMNEFHLKYPQFGFDKHKGYGTYSHIEVLLKNGPCEIHRKSFEPIKTLVKGEK